jgi:hypothetical protein
VAAEHDRAGRLSSETNPEQRTQCERYKRASFTNQANVWTIVTYGSIGYTCEDVKADTGVEFPTALCD